MDSDFWEQFPAIPGFNCLKMKQDIQAKIHEETKNMTQNQRLDYYRNGARKLRKCNRRGPHRAAAPHSKADHRKSA